VFSIVTAVIFIFGIYMFFNFLRRSFFDIFGVDLRHSRKLSKKIVNYFFYLNYIVILFVFLLTVLIINVGSPVIYNIVLGIFPNVLPPGVLNILSTISIFILSAVLLGLVYRVLSIHTISFKNSLLGGLWASVMLIFLNIFLSIYVSFSVTHSFYGFAGTLVVFLVWVHYAGFVLFLGAEAAKAHGKIEE
jgi:uncharacterized BrkB/YihY/UPF0761 family membrane protein